MLDGHKRWIGNGTWADVVCVWARNSETNQVGGGCASGCRMQDAGCMPPTWKHPMLCAAGAAAWLAHWLPVPCVMADCAACMKRPCSLEKWPAGQRVHRAQGHTGVQGHQDRKQDCAALRAGGRGRGERQRQGPVHICFTCSLLLPMQLAPSRGVVCPLGMCATHMLRCISDTFAPCPPGEGRLRPVRMHPCPPPPPPVPCPLRTRT